MIYTVTLNPSLDYIVSVDGLKTGETNRTSGKEILFPGGKGINVSLVLNNLGMDNTALGFVAGFTGDEIKHQAVEMGIHEKFISLEDGISRINVKIRAEQETEINGQGPRINEKALEELYAQLDELKEGDVLVLSGSIPGSLPSTIYQDIMKKYADRGIHIAVDATRELLTNVLPLHPFVIKPNSHELEEIFQVKIENTDDVIFYAKKLIEQGAENVLVSMAGDGAVMVTGNGTICVTKPPKGKVVNSVGAGDSMVAGFLYGYMKYQDFEKAFYYGVCTGSASAFSENLATKEQVEKLLETMNSTEYGRV